MRWREAHTRAQGPLREPSLSIKSVSSIKGQWFAQEEGGLFGAGVPERLREPWALGTPALAKIDGDASWGLAVVAQQLGAALGVPPSSLSWRVRSTVRLALRGPETCFVGQNRQILSALKRSGLAPLELEAHAPKGHFKVHADDARLQFPGCDARLHRPAASRQQRQIMDAAGWKPRHHPPEHGTRLCCM